MTGPNSLWSTVNNVLVGKVTSGANIILGKLGNRSALEWVIDQYRVSKDDDDKITSDPNRMDDEEYIVRLVGQVITISLEAVRVVKGLPAVVFVD